MFGGKFVSYVRKFIFTVDEKRNLSDGSDDFFEYTRGKKIPPEGIPGFDFSDPESIVEFTKYVLLQLLQLCSLVTLKVAVQIRLSSMRGDMHAYLVGIVSEVERY